MTPLMTIEKAMQPISPALRSEIEALWAAENIGIADVDARIAQIKYCGRSDSGVLAGVCSSTVEKGIFNGLHFHSMRVMVAGEFRQNLLAYDLLAHLVEELGDKQSSSFQVGPVGAKVVIQTPIVADRGSIHCARSFQFPINKTPKKFLLSGFTAKAHPEYCHYFPDNSELAKATEERWARTTEAFSRQAQVEAVTLDSLTADEKDMRRLLQQAGAADDAAIDRHLSEKTLYALKSEGQLMGVCELTPRFVPEINGTLLGLRTQVAENIGAVDIPACFARDIYAQLNQPGSAYPHDAVGLFIVYSQRSSLPTLCPVTGFHLHGVDVKGQELRVQFFDEVKVKVPL